MIAMIVGRVAVDAGSADSERHESVRQRRVAVSYTHLTLPTICSV